MKKGWSGFTLVASSLLIGLSLAAWASPKNHSSNKLVAIKSDETTKGTSGITPVERVPSPSPDVVDALNHLNESAGDYHSYRLPPTGYIPVAQTKESQQGKALYDKYGCGGCHQIKAYGGTLGPPLDGIGGHRGEQFLIARLLDPAAQTRDFPELFGGKPNIMLHLDVPQKEAKLIARYLLTLPEPEGGFVIKAAHSHRDQPAKRQPDLPPPASKDEIKSAERGKEAFVQHGCAACHTVDGSSPRFGPRLDGISLRRTRESIEDVLSGGTTNLAMKAQATKLTPEETKHIIDFLMTLPPPKEQAPSQL